MTASNAPSIPPRPLRSQKNSAAGGTPKIPPRPPRRVERSVSPNRDSFAPSPLNETSFAISHGDNAGGLYSLGQNLSASNLPPRPPSVTLPSVGQEGAEYAAVCDSPTESGAGPDANESPETQTRNVGSNLMLHAPTPTLPASSAKASTAMVTRTDSPDDKDPHMRPLKSKVSFTSHDSSQGIERPTSTQTSDSEHGIPEIGLRVPMYPNAGDVQAPSPSAHHTTFGPGIGFHNDGQHRPGRHHKRTPSGKECPPGSYGLHGHGVPNQNKFEKAWYENHPEALEREENGEYGPGLGAVRAEWALSSNDLNRVVRETASKGAGYGTSPAIDGTPDEQVGYLASEEYALRITLPSPPSHHGSQSNGSRTHSASQLKEVITGDLLPSQQSSENAVADEVEGEDVIHVGPLSPSRGDFGVEDLGSHGCSISEHGGLIDEHSYGVPIFASDEITKEPAAEHLQPAISPYQERFFASGDPERSGSRSSSRPTSTPASRSGSRPSSIIGGIPGFARYALHEDHEELSTPLEDVEEYEPLFPEGENGEKPKNAVGRLKRPELNASKSSSSSTRSQRRKFPSQDIWEDAPSSAQLQATVTTLQLPEDVQKTVKDLVENTESPSGTVAGRPQEAEDEESGSFLPQETQDWTNPKFKVEMNSRPKQKFPSKDIWEDSPESLQLQTTVSAPQVDESKGVPDVPERPTTDAIASTQENLVSEKESENEEGRAAAEIKPALEKPTPPPRPARSKELVGAAGILTSIPARTQRVRNLPPADIPPMPSKPAASVSSGLHIRAVPPPPTPTKADNDSTAEPTSPPSERKAPALPERSKPRIPARPAKPETKKSRDSVDAGPSVKAVPAGSVEGSGANRSAPPLPTGKPKPAVPSRPNGGKLAALKAGFFSDLDKRLQQGPTAPKPKNELAEEQAVEEKAPLSDARKGRARGPVRRKPAASPSGNSEEANDQRSPQKFDISTTFTIWQVAEDGLVVVPQEDGSASPERMDSSNNAEIDPTPALTTNVAVEKDCSLEDIATAATKARNLFDSAEDTMGVAEESQGKVDLAGRMSTEGQDLHSVASKSSTAEVQDGDPALKTAKDLYTTTIDSPTVESAAAADETAAPSRESAVERKGVSEPS